LAKGLKAVQAVNPDTFGDGEGQYILTATDALQLAYDSSGTLKEGSAPQALSRFTGWLVDAIGKGEAAPDTDCITLDALFNYLSHRARIEAAGMTPKRFVKRNSGDMVIARNPLAMPAELPEEIIRGLDAKEWQVRRDAVIKLGKLADQPRYRDLAERGITDHIGVERDVDVRAAMLAQLRKLGSEAPAVSNPIGQPAPGLQSRSARPADQGRSRESLSGGGDNRQQATTGAEAGLGLRLASWGVPIAAQPMVRMVISRTVTAVLVFGIISAPYIFAWFTLRRGYSPYVRVLSFGWLAVLILIVTFVH
jgi:hypothetical protein